VAGRTEEEIYSKLKLDFIPPELRENTGEIAALKTTSCRICHPEGYERRPPDAQHGQRRKELD